MKFDGLIETEKMHFINSFGVSEEMGIKSKVSLLCSSL